MPLHLRWDRGNQVGGVGLVTIGMLSNKPHLWVGLRSSTEFYPGCGSMRTHSQPADKVRAEVWGFEGQQLLRSCMWQLIADAAAVVRVTAASGPHRQVHLLLQRPLTAYAPLLCCMPVPSSPLFCPAGPVCDQHAV